ncbi:hypothetical protein AYJ57_21570 (plasmid) [Salipiger sp. CCB-MM3]|uniref:hypothetical protein n=1 Tax=Salipiger sp. CCB-MM3 TaxID=1792508 RepID=UPI00080AAC40|nr:hypothetical protein [Salipiger sp. CCB-MM3]ANT63063.1 hypothetical protein AYJ57_21570 [Salipiger sp. CCB-MM3]
MSNSAIEIKDRSGDVRHAILPCSQTGKFPRWSEIFLDLALQAGGQLKDDDFSSEIHEQLRQPL